MNKIRKGDEIIVTAYSWSSSATCILHHNCIPVFVDIDWATMNMDVEKIEAAITAKTKAIIVVHLHGLAVDMDKVMAIAKKHGLKVIEDACQAHGTRFRGKKVGTMGHCGAFSFNQNKNLCSGEGGMFVSDDEETMKKARSLWSFGETRSPVEQRHPVCRHRREVVRALHSRFGLMICHSVTTFRIERPSGRDHRAALTTTPIV